MAELIDTDETVEVAVHLGPDDLAEALRRDVVEGLGRRPLTLPPKWFYDDVGCELFERITNLDEYYLTRAERSILLARAPEVAAITGASTLVELGSGTSDKTRTILDALTTAGSLERFVAFDVNRTTVESSLARLAVEYPGLRLEGVVGDFERHLRMLAVRGGSDDGSLDTSDGPAPESGRHDRRLVAFLGSTIGNLDPPGRLALLGDLAASMHPGDHLLLGTDLVKDPGRLVAAYDDVAGVTAEFNLNVLRVLGRELGATLDPDAFEHVAAWDPDEERIEMRLRSRRRHSAEIAQLGLVLEIAEGEEIRTEICSKFTRERVETELGAGGFELVSWWTDAAGDYALSLSLRS